jgi:hypothetical protein
MKILHVIFLIYFISHIPITIFLDSQVVLKEYIPKFFIDMNQTYIKLLQDKLLESSPLFLNIFVYCELLFQLPMFFLSTYAILLSILLH